MNKGARQYAVKEIISSSTITTHHQLRRELKRRGFTVTQATLSRDLNDLGVIWISTGNQSRYSLPEATESKILRPLVTAEIISMTSNESLIVIHTLPGCANTVGEFIDVLKHPSILGTVAGDNTLLVIPKSMNKTNHVIQYLKEKLIG